MTPIPVPHRWLATILGVAFALDVLVTYGLGLTTDRDLLSLPGSAAIALCAYLAISRPVVGAVLGIVALSLSSGLIWIGSAQVESIGLVNITLTELVAGTVLTVLVVWRATRTAAIACVAGLVVACIAAIWIRGSANCGYYGCAPGWRTFVTVRPSDIAQSMVFGFFLLAGSVGAGLYLRRAGTQRIETAMTALLRKQWPLAAALAVLGLFELAAQGSDSLGGVFVGAIAGVCAYFAPKRPRHYALVASAAIAGLSLLTRLFGGSGQPLSFTTLAASMALVAYLVRYRPSQEAAFGTSALVAANGFAIGIYSARVLTDFNTVLILLFLLGVAVATGWYFRARDRERNQTVRAAVNSAQQGERMALARELHDVVAHHVTGIVVQAQAALMVAEQNPGVAVTALEKIEHSGTEALTAMRTLVGSLRDGTAGDAAAGQATTDLRADLVALVENFMGPPVNLDLDVPEELPHEVGRSVLRLVQESLTNVGKHAPDARDVRVRVLAVGDQLHIRVVDDGSTRPTNPVGGSGGYGLVGMRERVELLGGRFEAGPSGYVGWSVEAWLPIRKEGT